MRWGELFDDLEAQVMRAEREAFEDEVRARAAAERAAVSLGALLAASEGTRVRVGLIDGEVIDGEVRDCAAQWLHLADGPREWLVPATAIAVIDGAPTGAPEPGLVASRLTLGHALRALAEGGVDVVAQIPGTRLRGRIDGVGADYLVLSGRTVAFAALITVSPAP
jgi:hypothetical protein